MKKQDLYKEYLKEYYYNEDSFFILSEKETIKLFEKYDKEDITDLNKIIEGNLWLVIASVYKYKEKVSDFDSLVSVGILGLIKAVYKYDYKRSNSFNVYAYKAIKNSINNSLCDEFRSIRLPYGIGEKLLSLYNDSLDMESFIKKATSELSISDRKAAYLYCVLEDELSFENAYDDSCYDSFNEHYSNNYDDSAEDIYMKKNMVEEIRLAIKEVELTELEKRALDLRFGLSTGKCLTLREIGKIMNRTCEGVRLLVKRAITKISFSERVAVFAETEKVERTLTKKL